MLKWGLHLIVYNSLREVNLPPGESCVALGLFDGLHPGHQKVIRAAVEDARAAGRTPCVFTFSIHRSHPAAKPTKGRLLSTMTRDRLLADMGVTHMLCPVFDEFKGLTPEAYVQEILHGLLRAKKVYCGENYHFGKNAAGTVADLQALGRGLGIAVLPQPMVIVDGAPVSSTRIRQSVAAGDMAAAHRLLGRPYSIDFEVIHGRRLGRTIDSPTINQALPDWFMVPRFGVYASVATVDGKRYVSVSNIGVKPTVGSDRVLAETCLLGYDGDLYGRRILVEFLEFIRPEEKFASIDVLRAQIQADSITARNICDELSIL